MFLVPHGSTILIRGSKLLSITKPGNYHGYAIANGVLTPQRISISEAGYAYEMLTQYKLATTCGRVLRTVDTTQILTDKYYYKPVSDIINLGPGGKRHAASTAALCIQNLSIPGTITYTKNELHILINSIDALTYINGERHLVFPSGFTQMDQETLETFLMILQIKYRRTHRRQADFPKVLDESLDTLYYMYARSSKYDAYTRLEHRAHPSKDEYYIWPKPTPVVISKVNKDLLTSRLLKRYTEPKDMKPLFEIKTEYETILEKNFICQTRSLH